MSASFITKTVDVDIEIDLDDIPTEDLMHELHSRRGSAGLTGDLPEYLEALTLAYEGGRLSVADEIIILEALKNTGVTP